MVTGGASSSVFQMSSSASLDVILGLLKACGTYCNYYMFVLLREHIFDHTKIASICFGKVELYFLFEGTLCSLIEKYLALHGLILTYERIFHFSLSACFKILGVLSVICQLSILSGALQFAYSVYMCFVDLTMSPRSPVGGTVGTHWY